MNEGLELRALAIDEAGSGLDLRNIREMKEQFHRGYRRFVRRRSEMCHEDYSMGDRIKMETAEALGKRRRGE